MLASTFAKNLSRDEYLSVPCLTAKAGSEITCRAYSTIVEPLLEADRADRRVASGDARSEAKLVATLSPAC